MLKVCAIESATTYLSAIGLSLAVEHDGTAGNDGKAK